MTPQERQLVSDLFDRLSSLEDTRRDPEAERLITEGFRRAPNAAYALVQTVLVQDEALKRAEAHIRDLEGGAPAEGGGFLDSMRQVFLGQTQQGAARGSVPSVGGSKWNSGQVIGGGQPQQNYAQNVAPEPSRGSSFLGTAAATAAGVIGGSILFNSLGSMFGNRSGQAVASPSDGGGASPWGNASNSDLAREAGYNDIGGRGGDADRGGASSLFGDQASDSDYDDSDYDDGGDFGGGDMSDA
jgi:hypothetical protein